MDKFANTLLWLENRRHAIRTNRDGVVETSMIELSDLRTTNQAVRADSHRLLCGAGLLRIREQGYELTPRGKELRRLLSARGATIFS